MIGALPFKHLSDAQLVVELKGLAGGERESTVRLIQCLEEFDRRRLYLSEGASSLFSYCVQHLHLCEYAAYARIEIARASRRFPEILNRLRDGRLTLTNAGLLSPHLTEQNHLALFDEADGKRKDDVRAMIARIKPLPPAQTLIRKVATPRTLAAQAPAAVVQDEVVVRTSEALVPPQTIAGASERRGDSSSRAEPARAVVTPLSPEHYKVQLTISRSARDQLREVQDLMRHSIPNGDASVIFERAIALLLEDLKKKKLAIVQRPRASSKPPRRGSRTIPAAVRRTVWARDEGRCAFVGRGGRCGERAPLEFHHVRPFADGGPTTVANIELRCRAHNAHEAELYFGTELVH